MQVIAYGWGAGPPATKTMPRFSNRIKPGPGIIFLGWKSQSDLISEEIGLIQVSRFQNQV